ncbi:MAG: phenylacetate--CoA ligase family protein [Bryobacteraceae bacterium]
MLTIYHSLPPFARNWAASIYGWRLRHWRFGPETERLVTEALERERWPVEKLRAWCEERLARILWRAERTVPFYRAQWSQRRIRGDRSSPERIENWPVLEKETVRNNPHAFVSDESDARALRAEQTSGTTGTPLRFWESRQTSRLWYALAEARWRRWYGVSFQDRWAILGGKVVAPIGNTRPPFWVWNRSLNQLYVSSYHLSPPQIAATLDAMERYGVRYLSGYTAALNALAKECLAQGRRLPMEVVVTEAEPLFHFQRASLEEAFACPVRETYGMCEHVGAASECECGCLHLWPEAGWAEVFQAAEPLRPGRAGDLVFTGLLNADMPFIRYRIGDRASLAAPGGNPCGCGRRLPILESFVGRVADVLYTADGRTISSSAVDIIFTVDLPLKKAQVVQKSYEELLVRYVPAPGFDAAAKKRIADRLEARIGAVKVRFESMPRLPRGANGKFKVVASELMPPVHAARRR